VETTVLEVLSFNKLKNMCTLLEQRSSTTLNSLCSCPCNCYLPYSDWVNLHFKKLTHIRANTGFVLNFIVVLMPFIHVSWRIRRQVHVLYLVFRVCQEPVQAKRQCDNGALCRARCQHSTWVAREVSTWHEGETHASNNY